MKKENIGSFALTSNQSEIIKPFLIGLGLALTFERSNASYVNINLGNNTFELLSTAITENIIVDRGSSLDYLIEQFFKWYHGSITVGYMEITRSKCGTRYDFYDMNEGCQCGSMDLDSIFEFDKFIKKYPLKKK